MITIKCDNDQPVPDGTFGRVEGFNAGIKKLVTAQQVYLIDYQ